MRKRRGVKRTSTGRVVYNRKPHQFTEKDALRVIRSLLDNRIDDPVAFFSVFLLQVIRLPITVLKDTQKIRLYFLGLVRRFLPSLIDGILTSATKYSDEFLTTVYNLIISWANGMKPSVRLDDLDDIGD
jgi:hypothetical protein